MFLFASLPLVNQKSVIKSAATKHWNTTCVYLPNKPLAKIF